MRLSYCLAICLMQILFYANANADLAKFVVKVETKHAISIKDVDTMHVVVKGNNNDGTPIDGKVTLGLNITRNYNYFPYYTHLENIKTVDMVNGRASFDYNITELDLEFSEDNRERFIEIVAEVKEKLTGAQVRGTATTVIYPNRYHLSSYLCAFYEKPLLQKLIYQITHIDGSSLNDTKSPVELNYYSLLRRNNAGGTQRLFPYPVETSYMNETGFVTFRFPLLPLPQFKDSFHFYGRELKYLGESFTYEKEPTKNTILC